MSIESISFYKSQKIDGNRTIITTDMMVTLPESHRAEDDQFDFYDLSLADLMTLHNMISNLIKIEENEQ